MSQPTPELDTEGGILEQLAAGIDCDMPTLPMSEVRAPRGQMAAAV